MRFIQKGPAPPELAAWTSQANDDWQPVYEDLTGSDKKAIREALAHEQGHLCGYCGCGISDAEGDAHIEHVVSQEECKRTARRHLLTDYGNMLGSCMGTDDRSRVPKHCGSARGTKPLPVTPYQPDCEVHFVFGEDGSIRASTDPVKRGAADQTIRSLALDILKLRAARAAAIEGVLDDLAGRSPAWAAAIEGELDDLAGRSPDDWHAEAERYAVPDGAGHLPPFCFAIRQVLLRNAPRAVAEQDPGDGQD